MEIEKPSEASVRFQKLLKFLGFALNLPAARNEYREVLKAQGFADADVEAMVKAGERLPDGRLLKSVADGSITTE